MSKNILRGIYLSCSICTSEKSRTIFIPKNLNGILTKTNFKYSSFPLLVKY